MAAKPITARPVIFIVGPTASGKSSVAMALAEEYPVEIICTDSRTVVKGADIGTAKPRLSDREKVKHWCLDLVEPGQRFSVYDFKKSAKAAIADIQSRNKIPIVVGGSGLYVDSILFDYQLLPGFNPELRTHLESKTVEQLRTDIESLGQRLPSDPLNKRRLIRIIESDGRLPVKKQMAENMYVFGIWPEDKKLKSTIAQRIDEMFSDGFTEEVSGLLNIYGKDIVSQMGIGYSCCIEYLEGKISLEKAKELFISGDWQYARRQRTWLKRNTVIQWSDSSSKCYNKVIQFLNKNCSN